MTWRKARKLTAESDRRCDEFLDARRAWQQASRPTDELRQNCIDSARVYEEALELVIAHLDTLEPSDDKSYALHRANIYKRLLARQLARILSKSG